MRMENGVPIMGTEKNKNCIVLSPGVTISDFTIGFRIVDLVGKEVWLVDLFLKCRFFRGWNLKSRVSCYKFSKKLVGPMIHPIFFCWKIHPLQQHSILIAWGPRLNILDLSKRYFLPSLTVALKVIYAAYNMPDIEFTNSAKVSSTLITRWIPDDHWSLEQYRDDDHQEDAPHFKRPPHEV